MRLLRGAFDWGLRPQTPGIYRVFSARMDVLDCFQGTGTTCPRPFRPLSRSLGLLPSIALSRPTQVLPEWTTSTSPCNTFLANGDNPLNFVSQPRGSLQISLIRPHGLPRKILVDLQICHLNNCPGDDRDDNLRACCGWCHCNLDLQFHKHTRAARKDRARPLLARLQ